VPPAHSARKARRSSEAKIAICRCFQLDIPALVGRLNRSIGAAMLDPITCEIHAAPLAEVVIARLMRRTDQGSSNPSQPCARWHPAARASYSQSSSLTATPARPRSDPAGTGALHEGKLGVPPRSVKQPGLKSDRVSSPVVSSSSDIGTHRCNASWRRRRVSYTLALLTAGRKQKCCLTLQCDAGAAK